MTGARADSRGAGEGRDVFGVNQVPLGIHNRQLASGGRGNCAMPLSISARVKPGGMTISGVAVAETVKRAAFVPAPVSAGGVTFGSTSYGAIIRSPT